MALASAVMTNPIQEKYMDRFWVPKRSGMTAAITIALMLFTSWAFGQTTMSIGTAATPTAVAPMSTPSGSSIPALVSASGQLVDTRLSLLEQSVVALKEQNAVLQKELESKTAAIQTVLDEEQKAQDERVTKVESLWIVSLGQTIAWWVAAAMTLGVFGILVRAWYFVPGKIRTLIEQGKEGLEMGIIDKVFSKDSVRLNKFFEEQQEENRRRILARGKRIHLIMTDGPLSDAEQREVNRLRSFLERTGFNNLTATLDQAELVLVIGPEACKSRSQYLAEYLKGKDVPVVLYYGKEYWQDAPTSDFDLAILAQTLPTALMHLHNLAMLPISRTAAPIPT